MVFHVKFENNAMRAQCFGEKGRFSTKYGHESYVFLENGSLFTKYGQ